MSKKKPSNGGPTYEFYGLASSLPQLWIAHGKATEGYYDYVAFVYSKPICLLS